MLDPWDEDSPAVSSEEETKVLPSFQDAVKDAIAPNEPPAEPPPLDFDSQESGLNMTPNKMELYDKYAGVYRRYEEASQLKKDLDAEVKELRQLLIEDMRSEGIKSKKLDNGCTFSIVVKKKYSTDSKEVLTDWCLETGKKDKLSVAYQTLQGMMKALDVDPELPEELQGVSEVPEFVSYFAEDTLRVQGVRRKKVK